MTTPQVLERLAREGGREVRRRVASNPNASIPVLNKLVREFPNEILANPFRDLLALFDPAQSAYEPNEYGFYSNAPKFPKNDGDAESMKLLVYEALLFSGRHRELKREGLSPIWRKLMALDVLGDYHPRRKPNYGERETRFLKLLTADPDAEVRNVLIENLNTPADVFLLMAEKGTEEDRLFLAKKEDGLVYLAHNKIAECGEPEVRRALAANPKASEQVLEHLFRSNESGLWLALAGNHGSKRSWLEKFFLEGSYEERLAAAGNRNLSKKWIRQSVGHGDPKFRMAAANNKGLRGAKKLALLDDPDAKVRKVAWNFENLDLKVAEAWVEKTSKKGRCLVAETAGVSPEGLRLLARDPEDDVRRHLANRLSKTEFQHDVPINRELLEILAEDSLEEIRILSACDLRLPNRGRLFGGDSSLSIREVAAKMVRGEGPGEFLGDPSVAVRREAAASALSACSQCVSDRIPLPEDLKSHLCGFAADEDLEIRRTLAEADSTPSEALGILADDEDSHIFATLCMRSRFPRDYTISRSKTRGENTKLNAETVRAAGRSSNPFLRAMAARNSLLAKSERERLERDEHPLVRIQWAIGRSGSKRNGGSVCAKVRYESLLSDSNLKNDPRIAGALDFMIRSESAGSKGFRTKLFGPEMRERMLVSAKRIALEKFNSSFTHWKQL